MREREGERGGGRKLPNIKGGMKRLYKYVKFFNNKTIRGMMSFFDLP